MTNDPIIPTKDGGPNMAMQIMYRVTIYYVYTVAKTLRFLAGACQGQGEEIIPVSPRPLHVLTQSDDDNDTQYEQQELIRVETRYKAE